MANPIPKDERCKTCRGTGFAKFKVKRFGRTAAGDNPLCRQCGGTGRAVSRTASDPSASGSGDGR